MGAGTPHPADLANAGHGQASQGLRGLHCRLAEEEVDLVVIWVLALRNPEDLNELGFWPQEEVWGQRGASPGCPARYPGAASPSSHTAGGAASESTSLHNQVQTAPCGRVLKSRACESRSSHKRAAEAGPPGQAGSGIPASGSPLGGSPGQWLKRGWRGGLRFHLHSLILFSSRKQMPHSCCKHSAQSKLPRLLVLAPFRICFSACPCPRTFALLVPSSWNALPSVLVYVGD